MFVEIHVTKKDRLHVGTGSSGYQTKWYKDGLFIKRSVLGYEHLAEVLTTWLLKCSDIPRNMYVEYHPCIIIEDGKNCGQGCYSESFLSGSEIEVSISNILDMRLLSHGIGIDELVEVLDEYYIPNSRDYLNMILSVDSITRNEDRHFKNISLIQEGGIYRPGPIFDNGAGCMSDVFSYPMNESIDKLWGEIYAKPFSVTFGKSIKDNKPIGIYYDRFMRCENAIGNNRVSRRAFEVIKRGLSEMEGLAWKRL